MTGWQVWTPICERELLCGLTGFLLGTSAIANLCARGCPNFGSTGGPGYRMYYAMLGTTCVLLLCGGDKRKQASDINRAIEYLHDYKERTRKP